MILALKFLPKYTKVSFGNASIYHFCLQFLDFGKYSSRFHIPETFPNGIQNLESIPSFQKH